MSYPIDADDETSNYSKNGAAPLIVMTIFVSFLYLHIELLILYIQEPSQSSQLKKKYM
jgi:hypothetical protein